MKAPAALALLLAIVALGCGRDRAPAPPTTLPNVLFVTLDTTRADHLSAYGYARDTSPNLARIAAEGVRFDRAYSSASSTLPSHVSLFTGREPTGHGVVKNGLRLAPGIETFAERLRARGAQTAAIVSSFVLDRRFGLDRGFDHYEDDFTADQASFKTESWNGFEIGGGAFDRRANFTTDRAIRWLDEQRDPARPFLLFVHYFDPHDPYDPPPPWNQRFAAAGGAPESLANALQRREFVDAYDGEIAFTDAEFGRLLAHLEARGLAENTLVVVTADHGEGLTQHGAMGHAVNVYEEAVHVPLLLRWPGVLPAGRKLAAPVAAIDVLPTLLAMLGVAHEDALGGRDLGAALHGGELAADADVFTHRRPYDKSQIVDGTRVFGELFALRRGNWKWIQGTQDGTRQLFDLARDPSESTNLANREPARADEMSRAVATHRDEQQQIAPPAATEVAPDDQQRLRALGYVD